MKQIKWMKLKKIVAMLLATTTMVFTAATTLANEVAMPQVSQWSLSTMNEGEKYGIFPLTWYYEDFQKPITAEKLQILLAGVNKKLGKLNLKVNGSFKPEVVGLGLTRGEVITLLYNALGKYDMPASTGLNETSAVVYFQKRGILNGTGKGLELDKPCTVEQAAAFAILLIEDTYNTVQTGAKGLTWKVTKGDNTLYISGSIHSGHTGMYPIRQELKDVFKEADALLVEVNPLDPEGVNELNMRAVYDDGKTLKEYVSEDTYNKALKVFEQLGVPEEQLIQLKPWYINLMLSNIAANNAPSMGEADEVVTTGVDLYFITAALVSGKGIYELEGLKHQAELLNDISAEVQEKELVAALDKILSPPAAGEKIDGITVLQKQWYEGDLAGIKGFYGDILKAEESETQEMMYGKRDKEMADKLAILLDEEGKATYFVVVGIGHLIVEGTIIDQLKSKGYTVEIFK